MHVYTSHGYELWSEWELPAGTQQGIAQGQCTRLRLKRGTVHWKDALELDREGAEFSLESHQLYWPILGGTRIDRDGCVSIEVAPRAPDGIVPHAILGPILAHWILMQDLLALHANCVDIDGSLIAIVGTSGAGKSSLSAALVALGATPHGDDIV